MKKIICVILSVLTLLTVAGCSGKSKSGSSSGKIKSTSSYEPTADIDLTSVKKNVAYAEVYNMRKAPDKYIGKTVKMRGSYACLQDSKTGEYFSYCIVFDQAQCCSERIRFVLTGKNTFPDDYPSPNDSITILGTFGTFTMDGAQYCVLEHAKIINK